MSRRRTRSSKIYAKNPIVIQYEEAKERKNVPLTSMSINDLFNLLDVEEDDYFAMMTNINWDFLQQVFNVVTNPGSQWIRRKYGSHSCRREYLKLVAKGPYVQGCIIAHDLERLVENVHELDLIEASAPTKQETNDSSNKSKPKADSVDETDETESEEEPIKELEISKPREEMNVDYIFESRKEDEDESENEASKEEDEGDIASMNEISSMPLH
ncbi:hypothetical protein PVK06_024512 [Gossypium arboreum]|uniref:Uncharacterized protein n=1 Tax=Gossypium arboreum TaxID=29729 RepID=A0ABR0PE53_GOSAR|nr:hypothetical protein PVK06_024512 [Gossypium arboreum]